MRTETSVALLAIALALTVGAAPATAEKRAVIVGINAYTKKPLRGCVRDSSKMTTVVQGGFGFQDVTQLTDGDATRDNILRALGGVLSRSRPGDVVVFYFSGHGTLFPDDLSAELDEAAALPANPALGYPQGRYDSAICPIDADQRASSSREWGNLILDDEIYRIVSAITRKGALAFVISDSCNSGSLARDLDLESRPKFLPLAEILPTVRPARSRALPTAAASGGDRGLNGLYLSLTGSRDSQASIDNATGGFFTTALVDALVASKGDVTWMDLYDRVRSAVLTRSQGRQEPQLDTRFFRGSLDFPAFSVPEAAPATQAPTPGALRLVVRVQDTNGQPVAGALFCVVKPGRQPQPDALAPDDALVLGQTDARGLKDAGHVSGLAPGRYWVKVARNGHQTYWDTVDLTEGSVRGSAVLSFRLSPE